MATSNKLWDAYNKLLDSHEDYCLILEDDVELCDNFVNEINNCLSQLNSFDIFYCYHYTPLQFYNSIGKDVKDYFPEKWDKNLTNYQDKQFILQSFRATVSSGTYIRSLVHRIGTDLNCGALAFDIHRTEFLEKKY